MNEPGQQELKVSKDLPTQRRVEKIEEELKREIPGIELKPLRKFSRRQTANEIRISRLRDRQKNAEKDSMIDPLTGLHNRRWFKDELKRKIAGMQRSERKDDRAGTLWVLMADIDFFKSVNDSFGHQAGDAVIKLMKDMAAREDEPICRFGGEEFVQILDRGLSEEEVGIITSRYGQIMAEKSKVLLEKAPVNIQETNIAPSVVTLSFGLTRYEPGDFSDELLSRADQALYFAKQNGRNVGYVAEKDPQGDISFRRVG